MCLRENCKTRRLLQPPRSLFTTFLSLGAGTALNAAGNGAVEMVRGNPALVKVLLAARGGTGRLGTRQGLGNFDLLDLRDLGLLNSLGEESLDPGLVDEVEGGAEDTGQEEVEENATEEVGQYQCSSLLWFRA